MDINATNAISAYNTNKSLGNSTSTDSTSSSGFADLLKDTIGNSIQSLRQSEHTQMEAIKGNASTLELTEAVNSASIQIETIKACVDKLMEAHKTVVSTQL